MPRRLFAALAFGFWASSLACMAQSGAKLAFMGLPSFFYMPETGFGGGLMVMVTRSSPGGKGDPALGDSLRAGGYYTEYGQAGGWASLEAYLGASRTRLGLDGSISRYPSRFFGIGPSASADETYVPLTGSAAARLGFALSPSFRAGPRFRYAMSRTLEAKSDGLLAQGGLTGGEGYVSNAVGFALCFDTRDSAITPTKGGYLDLTAMAASHVIGSSQDFILSCLDARAYLRPLPASKLVLALQARAEAAFGDLPFQELLRIGGDKLMRGYYDGRYRDLDLLALQAEFRLLIWWRFGLTVFGGIAQVGSLASGFDLRQPKASGGIGARVRLDDDSNANMRVDIAWAEGGPQLYFNFGEAF